MDKCPSCGSELIFGIELDTDLKGYICSVCNYKMTPSSTPHEYQQEIYDAIREIQKLVKNPIK